MKWINLMALAALFVGVTLYAQPPDTAWTKTFGGTDDDVGESVQQTSDGGYIVAGLTQSYGAGYWDVYLVKTDASGDTLWTKTFGGTGDDRGFSVQQTSDGGYIVAGRTSSYGAGYYDVYLIKTDASGNTLWTKTFGGADDDYGESVQQTSDGGYIIAGETSSYGAGGYDVYLIKTDASGNTLWTKTFGGAGNDYGESVQQTSDGGYIIAGETSSYGAGNFDVYLVKTDASGNTLWTKTFGGADWDEGTSVQQTSDGGYIIAGGTQSYGAGYWDVYLIKTDASGDTLWTKTFGGTYDDEGWSVQQTSDGGYIIAGGTDSYGAGMADVYLVKTDASGDTLWTKTVGGADWDVGLSIQQTSDGGYIVAGYTKSFGAGNSDVYLIKLVGPPVDVVERNELRNPIFVLKPNPSRGVAEIRYELPKGALVNISVYNPMGQRVTMLVNGHREAGHHTLRWNSSSLASGVYFVRFKAGIFEKTSKVLLRK